MAIISENDKAFRRYRNTQFHYALIYVLITFVVLTILNVYCSRTSQKLFYQGKESSMIEKCMLAADEITKLDVVNSTTVAQCINQLDSLKTTKLLVTDKSGCTVYDSSKQSVGNYVLFPEIVRALQGNDVFTWHYRAGAMQSRAATPVVSYNNIIGCVYIMEHDPSKGQLIQSLQNNVLRITLILEIIIIMFSVAFSNRFSKRLRQIMSSMRTIQQGDYSHKFNTSGNDELAFLGAEFNDLTERLQTSEQKRRRFVSDASHELKTPLASIKLLTDSILQNDMDLETTREFVGDIGNEAERLNRMTAKLLSLTKVDSSSGEEEFEIIQMAPTIRRVVRMLSAIAAQHQITIETHLEKDCPILISEDELYQIVFNLVENGIKYNVPGGKIFVNLHRDDENAVLSVRDTGVGIPQDAVDHVFERFYRVDKARSRATGGSGLGLSIVRAIVHKSRGEIQIDSILRQGTTFTVTFPLFDTEVDDS